MPKTLRLSPECDIDVVPHTNIFDIIGIDFPAEVH
jgi:hypothetical protein